ncbi:MAG: truA [Gammaproteobacteria bacterium]|jgi:tRNA pseudouridine38-40 synthase|nr:truA [Gammaproteobacteria bacterium]
MRLALIVEYDGTEFHGWQYQPGLRTVQGELQKALAQIATEPIEVTCAGRTDRGVHAKYQVVHFDTHAIRPHSAWVLGVNHFLPKDICIRNAFDVPEDFHARYSATSRSYEYIIDNRPGHPAIMRQYATWIPRPLDHKQMHIAAQYLIGEHDFSSFRAAECQAKHPRREIVNISVARHDHQVVLNVTANAFLHHMVRNIVGTLLPIGHHKKPVEWVAQILAAKKRAEAGVTAPPQGLSLVRITYNKTYENLLKGV